MGLNKRNCKSYAIRQVFEKKQRAEESEGAITVDGYSKHTRNLIISAINKDKNGSPSSHKRERGAPQHRKKPYSPNGKRPDTPSRPVGLKKQ